MDKKLMDIAAAAVLWRTRSTGCLQHRHSNDATAWPGELPMNAVEDQIYEYACHERNYALPGMLTGAMLKEKEGN